MAAMVPIQFCRVLCPVDFSAYSDAAVAVAAEFSQRFGARLTLAHVQVPPATYSMGYGAYIPVPDATAMADERLEKLLPNSSGIEIDRRHLVGMPADEIVRLAEVEGMDIIIMGSHGHTGLARLLLGSVAEEVLRRTSKPVMVVKYAAVETKDPLHSVSKAHNPAIETA